MDIDSQRGIKEYFYGKKKCVFWMIHYEGHWKVDSQMDDRLNIVRGENFAAGNGGVIVDTL